jgi:hypothetical protein
VENYLSLKDNKVNSDVFFINNLDPRPGSGFESGSEINAKAGSEVRSEINDIAGFKKIFNYFGPTTLPEPFLVVLFLRLVVNYILDTFSITIFLSS